MKIYTLTIVYNEKLEEIEYLSEEISTDGGDNVTDHGVVDLGEYFDEEDLKAITSCYIVGEA